MSEEVQSNQKISQFNSAFSQLYRLDNLFQQANYHSSHGNIMAWNWVLDCIWRELAGDCNKPQIEKYYKYNKKIAENKGKKTLYQVLEFKEIFLRRLQNTQGKGTKYTDPDEDSMDEEW